MKVFQRLVLSVAALGAVTFVHPVYAVNESDCSIWLCLPTGFPSGCGDAKSAFKKRIKNFKPPLPSLSSCLVGGGGQPAESSEMSSKDGFAAFIPEREICSKWERQRVRGEWESRCVAHEIIPTHTIKNTMCRINHVKDTRTPEGCSHTIRYVDTYMDGKAYGETYYFDNSGNKVSVP